ncbi:MAG: DUF1566 domain-containing protein [Flavobacteriales bacterium]|nr:DUF1566 domain-containing protein [Flavobacteriales bacterium]
MKKLIGLILFLSWTFAGIAQSPEKMGYQAVIRDGSNSLVTNSPIGLQISILFGSAAGSSVYTETHNVTSNDNGLITLEIGTGTVVSGVFSTIDWANGTYFLKTETDPLGGTAYTITSSSQLISVPYALHASTADSLTGPLNEIDGDSTNELQTISRTGQTVTLSIGGGTFQDSVNVYTAGTGIDITNNVVSIPPSTAHFVGELYGGGIVFHVSPDGTSGLIASLDELADTGAIWGFYGVNVDAYSPTDGAANTDSLMLAGAGPATAAGLCSNYSAGGFTDWYLPSNKEFDLFADNEILISVVLKIDGNSNTNGMREWSYYWTSTGYDSNWAWYYYYAGGYMYSYQKDQFYLVRAVRQF